MTTLLRLTKLSHWFTLFLFGVFLILTTNLDPRGSDTRPQDGASQTDGRPRRDGTLWSRTLRDIIVVSGHDERPGTFVCHHRLQSSPGGPGGRSLG